MSDGTITIYLALEETDPETNEMIGIPRDEKFIGPFDTWKEANEVMRKCLMSAEER